MTQQLASDCYWQIGISFILSTGLYPSQRDISSESVDLGLEGTDLVQEHFFYIVAVIHTR